MAALGAYEWVIPKFDWQNICWKSICWKSLKINLLKPFENRKPLKLNSLKPETIENQFVENQPSECKAKYRTSPSIGI